MKTTQLELSADLIGNRDDIRANSLNSEQIIKIQLEKIIVREGFNVRHDYGDIESLAASILENGQSLPGRVDVLKSGKFVLTDGHRRFKALQSLEKKGHDVFFKAVVNTSRTTEEERIIQMFTTQDNKHLEPQEAAVLIQRLITFGKNQSEIAKRIGKSTSYVSQMISFSREDSSVKALVASGKTTVSTVLKSKSQIKNKEERTSKINEAAKIDKVINVNDITGKSPKDEKVSKLVDLISDAFQIDNKILLIELIESVLK